jgi:hypothetical protein
MNLGWSINCFLESIFYLSIQYKNQHVHKSKWIKFNKKTNEKISSMVVQKSTC